MAAPRSIGSLTVSFGLVAIPVKLYTATQSTGQISFNMLHKDCGSRLKQQYVCLKDGDGRRARRHRQGLRIRQGPVRRLHDRGDQGARGSGHARGRDFGVRADRVDRSGVLRQDLLPRARQGRVEAVCAAHGGAQGNEALRGRPLGVQGQGVHRDPAAGRRHPRHAAAAIRHGGPLGQGSRRGRRPR